MDLSSFIFLSVVMVSFGYIAGNAKSFNFWKFLLLGLILFPFITQFDYGKAHLFTMIGSFLVGYLLPYGHMLEGLGESISDTINAVRYKDAYEDIKRKEEEVEELRRRYEEAQRQSKQESPGREQARRREQSRQYRRGQQGQTRGSSKQESSQRGSDGHKQGSSSDTRRNRYLNILGLEPGKSYSYADIKKAYRHQASKFHPDKHHGKDRSVWNEMNEKFKEVGEAYKWLATEKS